MFVRTFDMHVIHMTPKRHMLPRTRPLHAPPIMAQAHPGPPTIGTPLHLDLTLLRLVLLWLPVVAAKETVAVIPRIVVVMVSLPASVRRTPHASRPH